MAKAQAKFVEYTLTILLSVIVMISVIAIAYTFYLNVLKNEIREGLKQIALHTSDSIVKIYQTAKTVKAQPSNQTSVLISEIELNLPTDVSKRNYEVILVNPNPFWLSLREFTIDGENVSTIVETSGPKVIAQTTQDPIIKVEHSLPNIDVYLEGKIENGKEDKLRYFRYNINNTIRDVAVLGEADILIDWEVHYPPWKPIFEDGFESGDYSAWTGTIGNPEITTEQKYQGIYGSKQNFTAQWQAKGPYKWYISSNPVYIRWYFLTTTLPSVGYSDLFDGLFQDFLQDFYIRIGISENYYLRLSYNRPSSTDIDYQYNFQPNTWYCIEVKFYLHPTNGEYRVYLNENEVITATGLNTAGAEFFGFRLGYTSQFNSNFVIYVDDVKVANTYIGC